MKDTTGATKKMTVKSIRKMLEKKINQALSEFKDLAGNKKFDNHVKKTARALGYDIAKGMAKKKKKIKKNS